MKRQHVILVPGIACDAHLWRAQCDALADIADVRAIVPAGDSMDDMADDILSRAPHRIALAGLSMGGYVALAILRRAPERVSRICLVNTSARADSEVQQAGRSTLIAEAAQAGGFENVVARLLPILIHPDRRQDAELRAGISDMMRRSGPQTFIRQQKAAASRPDSRPGLATITVPACIIAGRADRVTPPEHAVEMANAIGRASLQVLENCAHMTPMESPAQVSGIMRSWLAEA